MKRFTETEKWRDAWFSELSFKSKMVWVYITDNCDSAGVWDPNRRLAEFSIGTKLEWADIERELAAKIIVLPNGKWWIPSFIAFQYGKLSPGAQIHRSVLAKIEAHGLVDRYSAWVDCKSNSSVHPMPIPCPSHDNGMNIPSGTGTDTVKVQSEGGKPPPKSRPTLDEWLQYASTLEGTWPRRDAQSAFDHYEANGWKQSNGNAIKDWKAAARNCHGRYREKKGITDEPTGDPLFAKFFPKPAGSEGAANG